MSNLFSATDIAEIGVQIEKNGKDFYDGVAKASKDIKAKEISSCLYGRKGVAKIQSWGDGWKNLKFLVEYKMRG